MYHLTMKNKTTNALAIASYRAGCKLKYNGKHFDYTNKKEVVYSEIILCENAPKEYSDRQKLWESVEDYESKKQINSRRAKELEIALPNELTFEKSKELCKQFIKDNITSKGMIADYSIHWKKGNHHIHILSTTRPIKENGEWGTKEKKEYKLDKNGERIPIIDKDTGLQKVDSHNRKQWERIKVESCEWDNREYLLQIRKQWANECNKYLSKENQITEKSHEQRKKDGELDTGIMPLKYVSRYDKEQEKKGNITPPVKENIEIKKHNQYILDTLKQLEELKKLALEKVEEIKNDIEDRLQKLMERRKANDTGRDNGLTGTTTNGDRAIENEKQELDWRKSVNERANREDERERLRIAGEQEIERAKREREAMERAKRERIRANTKTIKYKSKGLEM